MTNINPIINGIAIEQGIEVGSPAWVAGGLHAISTTTGGHPAYGWRQDHKLLGEPGMVQQWIKAAFANYGDRRCYYLDAPYRSSVTGRPTNYFPEQPGDLLNGYVEYTLSKTKKVLVSGPDILHFNLQPLFAICDSQGFTIMAQGYETPANLIAGIFIRLLMKSLAGMVRIPKTTKESHGVSPYLFSDRGQALLVGHTVEATRRNLIDPEDLNTLATYINYTTLPYLEKAPGWMIEIKDPAADGLPSHQTYNGLYWLLPRLYDAMILTPPGVFDDRLTAVVKRYSKWMEDLEVTVPGHGCALRLVSFPETVKVGFDGKPVDSLLPYITPANCFGIGTGTDWTWWGLRAALVAAEVLDSSILKESTAKIIEAYAPKVTKDNKAWFVGADGEYL